MFIQRKKSKIIRTIMAAILSLWTDIMKTLMFIQRKKIVKFLEQSWLSYKWTDIKF